MTGRIPQPPEPQSSGDPRATVEAARGYLAAVRQHKVTARPLSVLQREAHELRRQLGTVLDALDDIYLPPRSLAAEQDAARSALLAEVPASQRADIPEGDQASAVAHVLAARGDDVAPIVTGWLQAAREEGAGDAGDGTEPYCTTCGAWAGMFVGLDGWHHFRGDPAPGGQRDLYNAGHEPVIGWTRPAMLAPGEVAIVRDALDLAAGELRDRVVNCGECEVRPEGLCPTCASRMDRAEGYDRVAATLAGVTR